MGRKYDIAQRIAEANQKASIVIDADHEFVINAGKSAAITVMALAENMDKGTASENLETVDKILALVFKKEDIEYIKSLDLTLPAYELLTHAVMAAFSGKDLDEVEEETTKKK